MVLLVGFDVEGLELDGVDELGVDDEGVDDDGVDELGFELDGVVLDGAELDGLDDEEEESSEVDGAATLLEVESSSSSIDVDGEVLAVLLTVVSTWGMNAGGGVVSTEVAAAMATPPRMATAPMPMAMLAARLEIRLEVMSS